MKINPIILIQRSRNRKMEYRRSFPARLRVTGVCNASRVVASQCLRHVGIPYHDPRVKRIRSRRWADGGREIGGETMRGPEWDGRCGGRGNVYAAKMFGLGPRHDTYQSTVQRYSICSSALLIVHVMPLPRPGICSAVGVGAGTNVFTTPTSAGF